MFSLLRNMLIIAVVAAGAVALTPEPAQANDGYWNNYWSWYDGSYRPYYNRQYQYYRNYNYNRDFGFQYNPSYRYQTYRPNYGYGYRNPYYSRHALRGPHRSLEVNGFHFDWR